MTYYYDSNLGNDSSTLSQASDLVTKGLPAVVVSAGLGLANTAIALGNLTGANFKQINPLKFTRDYLGEDVAKYYRNHETAIDVAGLIASSIVPGTAAVRVARAGQAGLANMAAREGAGLLTRTTSKVLGSGQELNKLTKAIRQGQHSLTQVENLKFTVYGRSAIQNVYEAAAFEMGAILTNNQNAILNPDNLDYISAITSNLDTVAFGVGLGGAFGTLVGGNIAKGQLKKAQAAADKDIKSIAAVRQSTVDGAVTGDNLVALYKDFEKTMDSVPSTGVGELVEGTGSANTFLKAADHNMRMDIKAKLMELFQIKGVKIPAEQLNGSNLADVVEDFTRIFFNKDIGVDAIAQSFGGLESAGYLSRKLLGENLKVREGLLGTLRDKLDDFRGGTRAEVIAKAGKETSLERAYYAIRDERLLKRGRRKKHLDEFGKFKGWISAEDQTKLVGANLNSMLSTVRYFAKNSPEKVSEDMFEALLVYGKNTDYATLLDTSIGKQFQQEATSLLAKRNPELVLNMNHAKLTKMDTLELGKLIKEQGNLHNPDNFVQTTFKTLKAAQKSGGLEEYPLLNKLGNNETVISRYMENKVYFNTETRTFTHTPVGAKAADYGQLSLSRNGNTLYYAKGELPKGSALSVEKLLDGTEDVIDATAHWAKAQMTVKDTYWLSHAKEAGAVSADDIYSIQKSLMSFELNKEVTAEYKILVKMKEGKKEVIKELDRGKAEKLLATKKQEALLKLMEKNNKESLWSPDDLRNILNTGDEFINSHGLSLEDAIGGVNYTKTTNIELTYGAQDLQRNFALGEGMLKVERALDARRRDLGLTTQLYLMDRGASSMYVPNALNRAADFNPADSVTRASGTQTLVAAQQAENLGETFFQGISRMTSLLRQSAIDLTHKRLANPGKAIKGDQQALAELAVVHAKMAQNNYGLMSGAELKPLQEAIKDFTFQDLIREDASYLVPADLLKHLASGGSVAPADILKTFEGLGGRAATISEIRSPKVATFLQEYGELNKEYVIARNKLNRHTGDSYDWNEFTLPAMHPSLKDLPERAKVVFPQNSIFGDAGEGFIFARNPQELQAKIAVLRRNAPDAQVTPISQIEADARKLEGFDYDAAITSNSTNADLRKLGVNWDVLPEATPSLVDRFIDGTVTRRIKLDRSYIREHYIEDFRALELEDAAQGLISKQAENAGKSAELSPQRKLINSALGIQNYEEYKLYRSMQEKAAEAINNVAALFGGAATKLESAYRSKDIKAVDNAWEEINKAAKAHGLPEVYKEATDYIMSTSRVGRDVASATVSKMNAFTSWLMLRADQIQGMVNAFSTPITMMPAIKELRKLINEEAVGNIINKHAGVKVPFSDISFTSDFKLMMESFGEFFTDAGKKNAADFASQGLLSRDLQQLLDATESFSAVAATMDAGKINGWFKNFSKAATFLSDKSEDLVRYAAARAGDKIITDAIHILKDTQPLVADNLNRMRFSLLQSMVTKVHGNYVAAQRPTLFQGFGGQALGLFQTYQFNLIQMLTRNIQQGDLRNAMRMVATQGTIFGAQSIPGFQAINNHIGEKTNARTDLYAEATQNFGKELGDFLLYGAASAITMPFGTGVNFYTRGDLTPRTPILIPTGVDEVPIVNFMTKFVGAASAAYTQAGVDMSPNVLWQFLAHQGYSRPLSGVGQLMLGGKTTVHGTTVMDFDELDFRSLHTAVKLMGTQTTEESIALNSFYRAKSYQSSRQAELNRIGMGARVALQNGRSPDVSSVMSKYVEAGGDGANFDRWYQQQVKHAGSSEYARMKAQLTTPEGRYLQAVMD